MSGEVIPQLTDGNFIKGLEFKALLMMPIFDRRGHGVAQRVQGWRTGQVSP
jgi:hypothetical protein